MTAFKKNRIQIAFMKFLVALIDKLITEYEKRISELIDTVGKNEACNIAASEMITRIEAYAEQECTYDNEIHGRYLQVRETPSLAGLPSHLNDLTVGDIYIFLVWAMINQAPTRNYISAVDGYFSKVVTNAQINVLKKRAAVQLRGSCGIIPWP